MRMRTLLAICLALSFAIPAPAARRRSVRHPDPRTPAPPLSVVYVVEVRSFADSDGDGHGDLAGLTAHLDDLQFLGVDVLLLLAPLDSEDHETNYGFTPVDFERVDPDFGSNADLDVLIHEATERGIRVAIDLVLNHTSQLHAWKQQGDDWYVYRDGANPAWPTFDGAADSSWHPTNATNTRWLYGLYGGGRPDLNYTVPSLREEMKRIGAAWIARGVAGFRLTKAQFLIETGPGAGQIDTPETHAYLREFAEAMRAASPDVVLIGDSRALDTATLLTYFADLPLNFDYPLAAVVRDAITTGNAAKLTGTLQEIAAGLPEGAALTPFLSHFDRTRLATLLDGDSARMQLAASVLLTLPGVPFLYYGEEIGMPSGPVGTIFHGLPDDAARRPMRWNDSANAGFSTGTPWTGIGPSAPGATVAAQRDDASSLLSRYRALIELRRNDSALSGHQFEVLETGSASLAAWIRRSGTRRVLVVHNLDSTTASAPLGFGSPTALFVDPGGFLVDGVVRLPGSSSGIWELDP